MSTEKSIDVIGDFVFPIAAMINFYKLSDLRQQRFIILHFQRPDVQNGFYWTKIKVWARLFSFLEALGNNLAFCLFQFLEASHIP